MLHYTFENPIELTDAELDAVSGGNGKHKGWSKIAVKVEDVAVAVSGDATSSNAVSDNYIVLKGKNTLTITQTSTATSTADASVS